MGVGISIVDGPYPCSCCLGQHPVTIGALECLSVAGVGAASACPCQRVTVDIGGDESVAGGTAGVLSDSSGVVGVSDGWVVIDWDDVDCRSECDCDRIVARVVRATIVLQCGDGDHTVCDIGRALIGVRVG